MRLPTFSPNDLSPTLKPARTATLVTAALVTLLLLAACAQEGVSTPAPAPAQSQGQDAPDVSALLTVALTGGEPGALTAALADLPAPTILSETQVRNLHQPWTFDVVQTREYPGVSVELYEVGATGDQLLKSVHVTSPGVTFLDLEVGMTAEQARQAAGSQRPLLQSADSETYLLTADAAAPIQVTLDLSAGQLSAYTVHAYLD